ncbi:MAG: hypothetical protein WAU71_11540 [Pyrinomonadaceae bacterium]
MISRREFGAGLLGSLLTYSFLTSCAKTESFAEPIKQITKHWAVELSEICGDLRLAKIPQGIWQEQVEKLFDRIELPDLLKFIEFEKLVTGFKYPDFGIATKPVTFPELDGLPNDAVFLKKVFGMKKDRAIIPHGHSNMASAHLVLKGEFALKHFDKVEEQKNHLVIRQTIDKVAKTGSSSSISDDKNNVHWFVATSETAFTFDVIMLDLNDEEHEIHNLDIRAGEDLSDGLIRAKKIAVAEGLKKYGKEAFH